MKPVPKAPRDSSPSGVSRRLLPSRVFFVPLLAGLSAALLYARAIANGFALDDKVDLLDNRLVTGPLDLAAIFGTEYYGGWGYMASGHYRPLVNLTYKAVASVFGLSPGPYHALNVLLFAIVVALTASLVSRLAADARTGALAALLFAVHPVNSESVAALVGLKELSAAGLGILSVLLYVRSRESSGFSAARSGIARALLPAAAMLAALLFKETALAFVPIAVAAEFLHPGAPRARGPAAFAKRALRAWPLAASALAVLLLRAAVTGGLFRPTSIEAVDNPLVLLGEPLRRFAATGLLGRYLAIFAWPSCLSSDYAMGSLPLPAFLADPWIVSSFLAAAALAAALVWTIRRNLRAAAFGLIAFFASYALVSNVIVLIGSIMAERLFFLSSWGLSIAAAAALVACHDRFLRDGRGRRVAATVGVAAVILALAARTWVRIGDWKDNLALAGAVQRCYPGNVKVLIFEAERQARLGRHEEARALYERALATSPEPSYAQAAIGMYLLDRGEDDRAVTMLEACAASRSPVPGPVLRLAMLYLDRGRDDEAHRAATRALEAGPSYGDAAMAHVVLGEVFLRRGNPAGAEKEYRLAIRDDPGAAVAHFNLGRILEAGGRLEEALAEQTRAESLAPGDARVLYARALVEARLGRLDRSLETTERLLALDPGFAPAREHRARLQILLEERAARPPR